MAAGGVLFSNKDALIGAGPRERSGAAIFARSRELQPRLEPLVVPTASQIREFLPKGFNPQFVFENEGQEERDLASFVVVGPVTIKRVVGDYASYERPEGEAGTTQKYLEVEAIQKDPDKPFFGNPWLSFSNLLPEDLGL